MSTTKTTPIKTVALVRFPVSNWKRCESGGEANIYELPDGTLAKIFRHWNDPFVQAGEDKEDQAKIIQNRFWEIQRKLPSMPDLPDNVVEPIALLTTPRGSVVGYLMDRITDVTTLDMLWNKISQAEKKKVLLALYDLIVVLHERKVIIGDFKPRDVAWNKKKEKIYIFDRDSFSFPGFDCRTFSLGFVDRDLLGFKKNRSGDISVWLKKPYQTISDWVSYLAICLFVNTGIDPFDGTHKRYQGKEERVMKNITIFSKDVKYPDTALPLAKMHRPLLEKIFFTFQHNDKTIPDRSIIS